MADDTLQRMWETLNRTNQRQKITGNRSYDQPSTYGAYDAYLSSRRAAMRDQAQQKIQSRGLDIQQSLGERGLNVQESLGNRGLDIQQSLGQQNIGVQTRGQDIQKDIALQNIGLGRDTLAANVGIANRQAALGENTLAWNKESGTQELALRGRGLDIQEKTAGDQLALGRDTLSANIANSQGQLALGRDTLAANTSLGQGQLALGEKTLASNQAIAQKQLNAYSDAQRKAETMGWANLGATALGTAGGMYLKSSSYDKALEMYKTMNAGTKPPVTDQTSWSMPGGVWQGISSSWSSLWGETAPLGGSNVFTGGDAGYAQLGGSNVFSSPFSVDSSLDMSTWF